MSHMRFHLKGRFKPYVRMTQRGKWVKEEARAYLDSKARMALQFKQQMGYDGYELMPESTALAALIIIQSPGGLNNRDLDNEIKAVLDAAQGIVFPDDRWFNLLSAFKVPYCGSVDAMSVTAVFWQLGEAWADHDPIETWIASADLLSHVYEGAS